jgi:hypothetical protein
MGSLLSGPSTSGDGTSSPARSRRQAITGDADRQAGLRQARRESDQPGPVARSGAYRGSHLQRERRVALLATRGGSVPRDSLDRSWSHPLQEVQYETCSYEAFPLVCPTCQMPLTFIAFASPHYPPPTTPTASSASLRFSPSPGPSPTSSPTSSTEGWSRRGGDCRTAFGASNGS